MFTVSFFLTLAVLFAITLFLVIGRPPVVPMHDLPAQPPIHQGLWAKYVPSNIQQLSVMNYTLIRQLNASAVPSTSLLDLLRPNVSVTADMVRAEESMLMQSTNATVSLVFLTHSAFSQFAVPVAQAYAQNLTQKTALYLSEVDVNGQDVQGWLAIIPQDNAVAFANGDQLGRVALNLSLEAANGTVANVLSRTDVRQSFYILNASRGPLSLGIQNFPGVVQAGSMTMTFVTDTGSSIEVTYVVKFPSSEIATAQIAYMKSAYLSASSFAQYDQYLAATENQPYSGLASAVRLVG